MSKSNLDFNQKALKLRPIVVFGKTYQFSSENMSKCNVSIISIANSHIILIIN